MNTNNIKFVCAIRNVKDGSLRSAVVSDSVEEYCTEIRVLMHNKPDIAYSLFPEEWEVVYIPLVLDSANVLPLTTWRKANQNENR